MINVGGDLRITALTRLPDGFTNIHILKHVTETLPILALAHQEQQPKGLT